VNPSGRSVLCTLAVASALLGAATARAADPLRGATLMSLSGAMKLAETRCEPAQTHDCGRVQLTESFKGLRPATTAKRGLAHFRLGVRVRARGRGECQAASPPSVVTAPDGSMQILGGAERIDPISLGSTGMAIGASRAGARWAWLEPLDPGYSCTYFDQQGTAVALRASSTVPSSLVSPWIPPSVLQRAHFTVQIIGSATWKQTGTDGTVVTGRGRWTLTLRYVRAARQKPAPFLAGSEG
jgi:hypothetical protein